MASKSIKHYGTKSTKICPFNFIPSMSLNYMNLAKKVFMIVRDFLWDPTPILLIPIVLRNKIFLGEKDGNPVPTSRVTKLKVSSVLISSLECKAYRECSVLQGIC